MLNGFRPATDKIDLYGYSQAPTQVASGSGSTMLLFSDGTKVELVGVSNPAGSIIG